MNRIVLWIAFLLTLLSASAVRAQDIAGDWQGTLHAGKDLRVVLKIAKDNKGGWSAALYSIDQSPIGFPATGFTLEGSMVKFSADRLHASYAGTLSADGSTIAGALTQRSALLPLNLTRVTPQTAWSLPTAAPRTWAFPTPAPVRVLTGEPGGFDEWPSFSPDGQSVLFSRRINETRSFALFVVPATGGQSKPLAAAPLPVSATRANWSPTNNLIAFTGSSPGGADSLWIIKADGAGAHRLTTPGSSDQIDYPCWYPDGERLIVLDGRNKIIERIDLATGSATPLTDPQKVLTGMASVSPDGRQIALAGQKTSGQAYDQTRNTIWLIDGAGDLRTVEASPGQGRAPTWSPNGAWLAFESDRGSPSGFYALFVIHPDGSGLTQITDYALNADHPVWSPDGRRLVFAEGVDRRGIATIELPSEVVGR